MRVRPIFAWYDLWVGAFIDRPKRRLYVFPLPTLGLVFDFSRAGEGRVEATRLRAILEAPAALRGETLEDMRRVNEMIRRDLDDGAGERPEERP